MPRAEAGMFCAGRMRIGDLPDQSVFVCFRRDELGILCFSQNVVQRNIRFVRSAQVFHKNKTRRDVAVFRGRFAFDPSFFFKPARDPVQSFIRQVVGRQAIFAVEKSERAAIASL